MLLVEPPSFGINVLFPSEAADSALKGRHGCLWMLKISCSACNTKFSSLRPGKPDFLQALSSLAGTGSMGWFSKCGAFFPSQLAAVSVPGSFILPEDCCDLEVYVSRSMFDVQRYILGVRFYLNK